MNTQGFKEYCRFTNVWSFLIDNQKNRKNNGIYNHPTEKPYLLMKRLVELLSPKGATILDCFFGSGSTGLGAIPYRKCIGVEQSEEYCQTAIKKINNFKYQYELF